MTDPSQLVLSLASEPYFNHRSDPVYARRVRDHEHDWNNNCLNCLIPVTHSRLNRVITIVPQTIELYEVFDPEEYDSQINHPL